nr:craniofacial development protein 2-like [Tanacetum cinerariifolium]
MSFGLGGVDGVDGFRRSRRYGWLAGPRRIRRIRPQVGLSDVEKKRFWDALDDLVKECPPNERLIIGGDLNGHIGSAADEYTGVHGGYGFGARNEEGCAILEFATAHDLVVANSFFKKSDTYLITFQIRGHSTQIDYLMAFLGCVLPLTAFWCCVFPKDCVLSSLRLISRSLRFVSEGCNLPPSCVLLLRFDIYAVGFENRPPILNKDNYVPWSSRIIRYARSRPNGKMIFDSIENEPYVRRMIATPGEPDLYVPVPESFHEQTDEEITKNDIKRMDADDQAIQTILLGLPEDVYDAVDSCETAKEIWERVQQMMKGSDIGEQEKKAKLFNEWEKFTSTDGKSIESYYHRFMQLINDLKRNKHFPENIAVNLKFLNNLQPEWKRHVTIVRQTKNLHEADFTQIYDFLKMNQDELNELRAERLAKTHDPLALMAHSQNSYNFPSTHKDQYPPNFMQPQMTSLKDINDPTKTMNATLILFAKAFQLTTPTNNNQMTLSNPRNRQIAQPGKNMSQDRQSQNVGGNGGNQFGQYAGQVAQNQQGYNACQNGRIQVAQNAVQNGGNQNGLVVVPGIAIQNGTGNVVATRAEGTGNENQASMHPHLVLSLTKLPSMTQMAQLRRMIPEPGDPNREIPVNETFHVQTDDELTEKEVKQIEADDQAIQTILLGLPEDIYLAVDSCETAQEIWLRVQQMMKGSDIGI